MKLLVIWGSLGLILTAGNVAVAGPVSVAGKTFNVTGKFGGSAAVSCKVGGSHGRKIDSQNNISATISFNPDGTFAWSNDTLSSPVGVAGDWKQKGAKIDLDFDNPTAVSYIKLFGESYSVALAGGSATVTPKKYDFSGKINGQGVLKLTESGGFRIKASASFGGASNSCSYTLTLKRTYSGQAN